MLSKKRDMNIKKGGIAIKKGGMCSNSLYLIIKYIIIDNKYSKSLFTILNHQTCINAIDIFFKSHILPDLPDQMTDYVINADKRKTKRAKSFTTKC